MKSSQTLFHFKRTRKQRAWLFVNMALMCWVYIAALYGYENWQQTRLEEPLRQILLWAFSLASLVLIYVVWWHWRHPAQYEAIVTTDRMTVKYPGSEIWSFDIAISDIKRFELRRSLSHAGQGIDQHGVLLNDGRFHHVCLNYGVSLRKLHKAVQSVRPDVPFPSKVNQRVEGLLAKDYDDC